MKFTKLYLDLESGGKFISNKLNNGDFDYWLVLDVIQWHNATGETEQDKYCIEIQAVSPEQAGQESTKRALSSCGIDEEYHNDPFYQVEALSDYGVSAHLWNKSGNNLKALLAEARKESKLINMLFGFYMDRAENRVGSTGWDFIRGELVFRSS